MKLTSTFSVPSAPDKVVALFFDAATMRECLPGCEELEQVDEKTYQRRAHQRDRAREVQGRVLRRDHLGRGPPDSSEPAVVNAVLKGEDRRLGSTIKVDATMTIGPEWARTSRVGYELEMAMWGKLGGWASR